MACWVLLAGMYAEELLVKPQVIFKEDVEDDGELPAACPRPRRLRPPCAHGIHGDACGLAAGNPKTPVDRQHSATDSQPAAQAASSTAR